MPRLEDPNHSTLSGREALGLALLELLRAGLSAAKKWRQGR